MRKRRWQLAVLLMAGVVAGLLTLGRIQGVQLIHLVDSTDSSRLVRVDANGSLQTIAAASSAVIGTVGIDRTTPGTTNTVAIITGQDGIAGGTGVDGATVPRVSLATNVALPAGTNLIGKVTTDVTTPGTTNSVAIITGQDGIAGGTGGDGATVPRVTLATDVPLPAGTNLLGKTQPFAAKIELGLTELVGIDDAVAQNQYGDSVSIALGATMSGEIESAWVVGTAATGVTGTIPFPAGILYVFDADPTITKADPDMVAADWITPVCKIKLQTTDYDSDSNGAGAYAVAACPFHAVSTLYAVWRHLDPIAFNGGAGDDEQLRVNLWIKRES